MIWYGLGFYGFLEVGFGVIKERRKLKKRIIERLEEEDKD